MESLNLVNITQENIWLLGTQKLLNKTNEAVVVENPVFGEVLYRQIDGALARRIVNYAKKSMQVVQGTDAGFIKFGSRVDFFLPLNSNINVELNEVVKGAQSIIATL